MLPGSDGIGAEIVKSSQDADTLIVGSRGQSTIRALLLVRTETRSIQDDIQPVPIIKSVLLHQSAIPKGECLALLPEQLAYHYRCGVSPQKEIDKYRFLWGGFIPLIQTLLSLADELELCTTGIPSGCGMSFPSSKF